MPDTNKWPVDAIERRKVSALIPYARNARTHSDAQIAQIAASIKEWGWTNPVLIDIDGGLIAGHGRVLAARKLGLKEVPCMIATGWSEAQKRAYILADNQLALLAGWDSEMLKLELDELKILGFDESIMGFEEGWLEELQITEGGGQDAAINPEIYTNKVTSPVYEIRGKNPECSMLYDDEKQRQIAQEIDRAAFLDADMKRFLKLASARHVRFNYGLIAEKYAHSPPEIQRLFERSALVVIDFQDAIAQAYVKLSDDAMAAFEEQHDEE